MKCPFEEFVRPVEFETEKCEALDGDETQLGERGSGRCGQCSGAHARESVISGDREPRLESVDRGRLGVIGEDELCDAGLVRPGS